MISALRAVETSIKLASGEEIALDEKELLDKTSGVEGLFEEKSFEEALATTALALTKVLRMKAPNYMLAIILPGGSRIFYFLFGTEATLETVRIKMDDNLFDERAPYSFQAVKRGKFYWDWERRQTKAFLDLLPEIRNMIYEQIHH